VRWGAATVALLLAPILIAFTGGTWAFFRNDHDMNEWRSEFFAVSDFDGADVAESGSRFGLQSGTNGDHCDREAWLIYETDLGEVAVRAHFASLLDPNEGELTVTTDDVQGTIRVDWWYRFNETEWDVRCI
jgi:hypothetical protein